MSRRFSCFLIAAAAAVTALVAPAAAQTTPPFNIRVQQGTSINFITDGGTLAMPADAIGAATDGQITLTYRGTGSTASINVVSIDLSGSTDFALTSAPDLSAGSLTLTPNTPSFAVNVRFTPTASRSTAGRVVFNYLEGNRSGSVTVNLAGTAPEFAYTSMVQPNGNTAQLTNDATVAFPATNIDETSAVLIVATNRGSGPGIVNAVTLSGSPQFTLAGLPFTPALVEPGRDLRFSIRLTPKQLEAVSGAVGISLAAGRGINFNLQGSGLGAQLSYDVVERGNAPLLPGQMIALPDAVVGGDKTSLTIRVRNTGNLEGRIAAISIAGTGFALADVPFLPHTLAPGAATAVRVQFAPTQPGRATGRLRIGNDSFEVEGNALGATLTYSYAAGAANITVPGSGTVVFPSAAVGQTSRVTFLIRNEGTASTDLVSINLTGTSPVFTLTDLPALPMRVPAGGSVPFTIVFAPTTVGSASTGLRVDNQSFTLSAVGGPPAALPEYSFQGATGTVDPVQQPAVGLTLASAYPLALNGTLTLSFNSEVFANDPSVQFATGGRTISFTVPAGSRQAVFPNNTTQIRIQTGTVAGSISLVPAFATTGGIDLTPVTPPALVLTVPQSAPRLLNVTVSAKTANSFTLLVTGYATGRSITQMDFQFNAASGETVSTSRLSLNVEPSFAAWYQGVASQQFGSQFTATIPFTLQGDVKNVTTLTDTIQSVSVTLTNRQGASAARSVDLR